MKAGIPCAALLALTLGACGHSSSGSAGNTNNPPGSSGSPDNSGSPSSPSQPGSPGNTGSPASTGSPGDSTASVTIILPTASFTGNSVRICGERLVPAARDFRCENSLSSPDAGTTGCPCFNFAADGSLVDPVTGAPVVINNLCPSVDVPNDPWTFTYEVFSGAGCTGTQLNDGTHNFTCFDSRDLLAQANPNSSVEFLSPGLNQNHILCLTTNASKDFNFASCVLATTPADVSAGLERFQCGCTPVGNGTCDCGPNGVGPADLQAGCAFDPTTCDILCATP